MNYNHRSGLQTFADRSEPLLPLNLYQRLFTAPSWLDTAISKSGKTWGRGSGPNIGGTSLIPGFPRFLVRLSSNVYEFLFLVLFPMGIEKGYKE